VSFLMWAVLKLHRFEILSLKMRIISLKCGLYYTIFFPHESLGAECEVQIIEYLLSCVTFSASVRFFTALTEDDLNWDCSQL